MALKEPIFLISVPKCGTVMTYTTLKTIFDQQENPWLADWGLSKLPKIQNLLYVGHLHYSLEDFEKIKNYKKILLYRDPRDYVVSYSKFFNHPNRIPAEVDHFFKNNNFTYKDIMIDVIRGIRVGKGGGLDGVKQMYDLVYFNWISENSLSIKYEDMIGDAENQTYQNRQIIFEKILRWLNFKIPKNLFELIKLADGTSKTSPASPFRKGGSGDWKNHFDEYHKLLFKKYAPDLVSKLGYEKDENW